MQFTLCYHVSMWMFSQCEDISQLWLRAEREGEWLAGPARLYRPNTAQVTRTSQVSLQHGDLTSFSIMEISPLSLTEISPLSLSSIMEISPLSQVSHSYVYLRYFSLMEISGLSLSLLRRSHVFLFYTENSDFSLLQRSLVSKLGSFVINCVIFASADITRPIRVLIWKEKNDFCPVILLFGLNI